jgi:hypothetical protein
MDGERSDRKLMFIAVVFWLTGLLFTSDKAWAHAWEQGTANVGLIASGREVPANASGIYKLAGMVEGKDSVVYGTDSNNQQYEQRQWEEQQKENKSWNMLNNLVIDGRQPPRHPPGPRPNGSQGRQPPRSFSDSWAKDHP